MPSISQADLNKRLKELIKLSDTINSLPESERKKRTDQMLSTTPDKMAQLIKILENEQVEQEKIDQELLKAQTEIDELVKEVNSLGKQIKRDDDKSKEKAERKDEITKAEDLLKKLDEIV